MHVAHVSFHDVLMLTTKAQQTLHEITADQAGCEQRYSNAERLVCANQPFAVRYTRHCFQVAYRNAI
ncbi:hypothetical protein WJX84_001759 [Apatococcus fuscideae]|uniref:Uncharacterized protein n=1 Tax=Apatococcus fuscideae TaxID=2026836 RepID=A0AAW1SNC3_9CHLO